MDYRTLKIVIVELILLLFLCSCAETPNKLSVTSKNDGSFDAAIIQSAENEQFEIPEQIYYMDTFFSTDNTVEYVLEIYQDDRVLEIPAVEVAPHYLTEDDARRIANTLFENGAFYEMAPKLGKPENVLSQTDILKAIQRWSEYTNNTAIKNLYGSTTLISAEDVKQAISYYNDAYNLASSDHIQEEARWKFQAEQFYTYTHEQLESKNLFGTQNSNDEISVTVNNGAIPYVLSFSVRNKQDYKLNTIFVYPYSHWSPMQLDDRIFKAELLRTDKPTDEQMDAIGAYVQTTLEKMQIGEWVVDQYYLDTTYVGEIPEYKVCVTAVPSFKGIPAIRRTQLNNLKSEEAYASNYYLTDAKFEFSANGDLLFMQITSPIDIKEVLTENVKTLSKDELIEKAKYHLCLRDCYAYGMSSQDMNRLASSVDEDIICKVTLCEMQYGMIRVKVPNTDESYYYVPGLILLGTVDYYGAESGKVYQASGDTLAVNRINPILALNAVDGSVIPLNNE